MTSRRTTILLALVLFALISTGISACLQTEGQRRGTLRERANEILPRGARIRTFAYGECVELAPSPSCARVVFSLRERSSERRAEQVREAARAHGWTITRSGDAQGGWNIFLKRDGYTAFVVLWRPEVYHAKCKNNVPHDDVCFNTINLTRHS